MKSEKKSAVMTPAQYAFMDWLAKTHPNLYDAAMPKGPELSGLFDSITNGFQNVVQGVSNALNTYVTGKEQLQLIKLNVARAQQGLKPVTDVNAITAAPVLLNRLTIPTWVYWAGGAVLALLLWKMTRSRR